MYVADGTGTGAWVKPGSTTLSGLSGDGGSSNLRPVSNGSNGFVFKRDAAYAAMQIAANTNAMTVAAATDATLNTNTDYLLVSGTGAPWAAGVAIDAAFTTDRITVATAGVYKFDIFINVSGFPTATAKVAAKYRINGSIFSTIKLMSNAAAITDARNLAGSGLVSLNAADFVQLYVASTGAGSLTMSDVSVSLSLVKAT